MKSKKKKWETREEAIQKTLQEANRVQLMEAVGKEAQLSTEIDTAETQLRDTEKSINDLKSKKENGEGLEAEAIANAEYDLRQAEISFQPKKNAFDAEDKKFTTEVTALNTDITNLESQISTKDQEMATLDRMSDKYTKALGEKTSLTARLEAQKTRRSEMQKDYLAKKEAFDTDTNKIEDLRIARNKEVKEIIERYGTKYQEINTEIATLEEKKASQEQLIAGLKTKKTEQTKLVTELAQKVRGAPASTVATAS